MQLKVLGSSSRGNCYILENDKEALIIEAGIPMKYVKQALGYNVMKVVGCLISHEHGDHAKYVNDVLDSAIPVFLSHGTLRGIQIKGRRLPLLLESSNMVKIGGFKVLPFNVKHDAFEPLGFMINHAETGNILFATDTYYLPYTFDNLHNIMLECNYDMAILNQNIADGKLHPSIRKRTVQSHMSYDTCLEVLSSNALHAVNNIILIHLSGGNSDSDAFRQGVKNATGKTVHIAAPGLEITINKTPF